MKTIERFLIVLIFTFSLNILTFADNTETPVAKKNPDKTGENAGEEKKEEQKTEVKIVKSGNYLYSELHSTTSHHYRLISLREKFCTTQIEENQKLTALEQQSYYNQMLQNANDLNSIKNKSLYVDIDSVLTGWYFDNSLYGSEFEYATDPNFSDTATIADSVFIERIHRIPAVVELAFNEDVKNELNRYLRRRSQSYVERLIGKAEYYLPMYEQILDAYNMPLELKYLPIIESAVNPVAVSRAGATGMWQFMPATGKAMELEIDKYVDERCDPLNSTYAAARYLQFLYNYYNDWTLALAAYNCGRGNVNRAMSRSGGKTYWEIQPYLPRETQKYVPRYIAIVYVMNYYKEHNMIPKKFDMPLILDTVEVKNNLHLSQVSAVLDIPIEMLRTLNPQYKQDLIPAGEYSYKLTLPIDKTFRFIELQDSIYAADIQSTKYELANFNAPKNPFDLVGREKLVYTIKSGDNIGLIAQWYGVKSSNIKAWNSLYSNKIIVGDELEIYIPKAKIARFKKVNDMTFDEKQVFCGAASRHSSRTATKTKKEKGYLYYTVQSGDNYWDIAKKFKGISHEDIIRINNFTKKTKIYPGDEIKIKKL